METIINPETKRRIKINGETYNKLLKKGLIKPLKPMDDKVKETLRGIVTDYKKRTEKMYVDKNHELACKFGYSKLSGPTLTRSFKATSITYQFPISWCKIASTLHFLADIDKPNVGFHRTILLQPYVVKYNNYTGQIGKQIYSDQEFDLEWFEECDKYVKSLGKKDVYTLLGYPSYSHINLQPFFLGTMTEKMFVDRLREYYFPINDKGKFYFPLFFQMLALIEKIDVKDFYKDSIGIDADKVKKFKELKNIKVLFAQKYIILIELLLTGYVKFSVVKQSAKMYKNDLQRIIRNSPPTKSRMVVFRGVKDEFYLKNQTKKNMFTSEGFVSTSLNPDYANVYANSEGTCCIKRIIIPQDSRVLFIPSISTSPMQLQILINADSTFYITSNKRTMLTIDKEKTDVTNDVCYKNAHKKLVTDLVLIK